MNEQIKQIAQRIVSLRELLDITSAQMAEALGLPLDEYLQHEAGERDFPYSRLYEIAKTLGVDISELITGETPKLSHYSLIRSGKGLPIKRESGLEYLHLAYHFKARNTDPLFVTAQFNEKTAAEPIPLNQHRGQEFDYVLDGTLRVQIEENIFDLEPGDSIYYDSNHPHGMMAVGGRDCTFIAVVINQ